MMKSKQKTHKGLAKRVRVSAKGKIMRSRAFRSHLMSSRSAKRRRQLRRKGAVVGAQARAIKDRI